MRKLISVVAAIVLLATSVSAASAASASLGATISASAAATAQTQPKSGCTYFAATGHNLCAGFLQYWQTYGGLAIFGYPLTEEFVDANTHLTTQVFERAVFEWHPGAWPARWDVELRLLGDMYAQQSDMLTAGPFADAGTCPGGGGAVFQGTGASYEGTGPCLRFTATGHTLSDPFLDYWLANGGLAIFGYPISEQFNENGIIVQYFERQRMEWHPEFAGTPNQILLGRLGAKMLLGPTMTVVASGLDNPRQLGIDAGGTVWVAEAGKGGTDCIASNGPEGPGQTCFGATGAIAQIRADGQFSTFVGGLPSSASPDGSQATGPTSLSSASAGEIWTVVGGPGTPDAQTAAGTRAAGFGKLYRIDTATKQFTAIADLAAYEYANDPDKANPLGPNEVALDSNPYAVLDVGDARIVADAAGNDLLRVDVNGNITTLAVFPELSLPAPPFLKLPAGTMIPVQSVPTSVVMGPDGAYYVGELTGFPFQPGVARVWRVVPGQQPTVYASGFTNIVDMAFDSLGHLFVVEITKAGLLAATAPGAGTDAMTGAVIRVNHDGSHTEIFSTGLLGPGGIAIGPDGTLYVSNMSVLAGQGQVVKIDY